MTMNVNHECNLVQVSTLAAPPNTMITYKNMDPSVSIDLSTYFSLTGAPVGSACFIYTLIDNPI